MTLTTATKRQPVEALERANQIRLERVRQRDKLRHKTPREIVPAIVHPTPEFATFRLGQLFAGRCSLLRLVNKARLNSALAELSTTGFRRNWHDRLRLDELTERERRRLAKALLGGPQR